MVQAQEPGLPRDALVLRIADLDFKFMVGFHAENLVREGASCKGVKICPCVGCFK
jgi:hypothetical protein